MPSAQRVNWAKLRVTMLSVTASAIVISLAYLLTGGTLLQEKTVLYLYIPDATGLGSGSPVRVDGITVGKVRSASLSGYRDAARVVRVTLTVESDHLREIPVDSSAQISADTLVGDKFVDISSGTSPARMKPRDVIPYRSETALLKSLDIQQFEQSLRSVDAVISDIERGRGRVGQFVVGEQVYDDLRRKLAEAERAMRKATDTTTQVGRTLFTDQDYQRVSGFLIKLDDALARAQSGQGTGGRLLRDPAQYEQIRQAAADAGQAISKLRAGEFMSSDRAYAEWNRRLASLIQSVDEWNANPLMSTTDAYDRLNGALLQYRDSIREFRQDPRKFLRLKIF